MCHTRRCGLGRRFVAEALSSGRLCALSFQGDTMSKPTIVRFALTLALTTTAGFALAQQRQLGAHEHGRGTLNLAVEGTRVTLELEAPGADIVGFEHAAKTARQKAAVERATKQLLAPQSLFTFPAAAECVVADASVEIENEEHAQTDTGGKLPARQQAEAAEDEHAHSNFHAQYSFTCNAPGSITALEFGYFKAFAGAQKLEVNVITPKGQSQFEVTRAKPRIDLAGMI